MRKARIWQPFLIKERIFFKNRNGWLGREGSNLRMAESKSAALPLGYAPTGRSGRAWDGPRGFPLATPVYRGR